MSEAKRITGRIIASVLVLILFLGLVPIQTEAAYEVKTARKMVSESQIDQVPNADPDESEQESPGNASTTQVLRTADEIELMTIPSPANTMSLASDEKLLIPSTRYWTSTGERLILFDANPATKVILNSSGEKVSVPANSFFFVVEQLAGSLPAHRDGWIQRDDGAWFPVVTNDADGNVNLLESDGGIDEQVIFRVHEIGPEEGFDDYIDSNIKYDKTVYTITLTPDMGNRTLQVSVTTDAGDTSTNAPIFKNLLNSYDPCTTVLSGRKELQGGSLQGNDFKFEVTEGRYYTKDSDSEMSSPIDLQSDPATDGPQSIELIQPSTAVNGFFYNPNLKIEAIDGTRFFSRKDGAAIPFTGGSIIGYDGYNLSFDNMGRTTTNTISGISPYIILDNHSCEYYRFRDGFTGRGNYDFVPEELNSRNIEDDLTIDYSHNIGKDFDDEYALRIRVPYAGGMTISGKSSYQFSISGSSPYSEVASRASSYMGGSTGLPYGASVHNSYIECEDDPGSTSNHKTYKSLYETSGGILAESFEITNTFKERGGIVSEVAFLLEGTAHICLYEYTNNREYLKWQTTVDITPENRVVEVAVPTTAFVSDPGFEGGGPEIFEESYISEDQTVSIQSFDRQDAPLSGKVDMEVSFEAPESAMAETPSGFRSDGDSLTTTAELRMVHGSILPSSLSWSLPADVVKANLDGSGDLIAHAVLRNHSTGEALGEEELCFTQESDGNWVLLDSQSLSAAIADAVAAAEDEIQDPSYQVSQDTESDVLDIYRISDDDENLPDAPPAPIDVPMDPDNPPDNILYDESPTPSLDLSELLKGIIPEDYEEQDSPECPMPSETTASNDKDGKIEWKPITFTEPGYYVYQIQETGEVSGIIMDPTRFVLVACVTADTTGQLQVVTTTYRVKDGTDPGTYSLVQAPDGITFYNEVSSALLPFTGGPGTNVVFLGAIGCISGALCLIYVSTKQRRRRLYFEETYCPDCTYACGSAAADFVLRQIHEEGDCPRAVSSAPGGTDDNRIAP